MWTSTKTKFLLPADSFFNETDSFFNRVKTKRNDSFSYTSEALEDSCLLLIEVPGIEPKNISVSFSEQDITVKCTLGDKSDKVSKFIINDAYDVQECKASCSLGVLRLEFPKKNLQSLNSGTIQILTP
jgi:HSP20 family molecular chaperone IbpA